jgi:hypothetical protein
MFGYSTGQMQKQKVSIAHNVEDQIMILYS